jgi:hypothetical protein
MVWVFGIVFMVVIALAAWAGTGRLGEMPGPVDDRPKAFIPDLPFGPEFMERLRLPVVSVGYQREQVDHFLAQAQHQLPPEPPRFDVVTAGYDMQAVDAVINQIAKIIEASSRQPAVGIDAHSGALPTAAPGPADASEALHMRNNGVVHLDPKD